MSEPTCGDTAATFCATLVDEWVRLGVTDAVVAPGSRSTPIAVALDADPRVRLQVVHDERGASFMALGIGLATRRPAVVACSSGTAAVHFHAAVVEADLAAVPLLVVTADRPPELHGVLAPQTIDQRELYGRAARWYCEPGPPSEGGAPWWRDLAADAYRRSTGVRPGPVHLDLAFREPLLGEAGELPPRPRGDEPTSDAGAPWGLPDEDAGRIAGAISGRPGVIVAGVRTARGTEEAEAVWSLADALDWPVLADGASGMRTPHRGLVSTFDVLCRHEDFADAHRPAAVLRLGGLLTSKATGRWLAGASVPQFAFDRHGRCPDPDRVVSRSFTVAPADAARALLAAHPKPADPRWGRSWAEAERRACAAIDVEMAARGAGLATEPGVARDVMAVAPAGGSVVASSSMPVRDLEWFALPRAGVRVFANRGANGIDGVTATAIGVALGTSAPTLLLTGDVAFLHDASSLAALARRDVDLVIVVVDNDGGGIFHFLPQHEQLAPAIFERLFGTPHGADVAALAAAFGLPVERVRSRAGLRAALAGALARRGPRVVVVDTDRRHNTEAHRRLEAAVATALDAVAPEVADRSGASARTDPTVARWGSTRPPPS